MHIDEELVSMVTIVNVPNAGYTLFYTPNDVTTTVTPLHDYMKVGQNCACNNTVHVYLVLT